MLANETQEKTRLSVEISEVLSHQISAVADRMGLTKSAFVRQAVAKEVENSQEMQLAKAAEELASLYETNEELVAFTALDGDDFA